MSKARDLASLLSGGSSGVIQFAGTGAIQVPGGTTEQRPTGANGEIRYNSDIGYMETYASTGWATLAAPPVIVSVDVSSIDESSTTQTIIITGTGFDSTATAALITSTSVTKTPTTSTRNSSTQITITYSGNDRLTGSDSEPLSVRVVNGSGLSASLAADIAIDASPVWSTAAGSLGTILEGVAMSSITLSATDPEGSSVSYSVASGAFPTGVTLSSGVISGTSTAGGSYSADGVTHNFTIAASDGTGNSVNRSFSILRKWADGTSSAAAATSAAAAKAISGTTTNGYYWVKPTGYGGSAQQIWCDMNNNGGGWMLLSFCGTSVVQYHVADASSGAAFNMGSTSTDIVTTNQSSGTYGNAGQSFIDSLVVAGRSKGIGLFRIEDAGTTFYNWMFAVDANARYYQLTYRHNSTSNNNLFTDNINLTGNTWLKTCYLTYVNDSGNGGAGSLTGSSVYYSNSSAWGVFPCNMSGNSGTNFGYGISPLYDNGVGQTTYQSCHSNGWNRRGSFWLKIV